MNVKEGMRRIGLLLAILGSFFGVCACYLLLQDTIDTRNRHSEFERLVKADVVVREQKYLQSLHLPADAVPESTNVGGIPPQAVIDPWPWDDPHSTLKTDPSLPSMPHGAVPVRTIKPSPIPMKPSAVQEKATASTGDAPKVIHWTSDLGISSIQKVNGTTLYEVPDASRWLYVVALLLPIVGFLIPWGTIRIVIWIGAGFKEKRTGDT